MCPPPGPPTPARVIQGPTVRGRPRLLSVDLPGMNEREVERYNELLEEIQSLQVTATGRASESAPCSRAGNSAPTNGSLITGGEVVASLPQGMQARRISQLDAQDYVSTFVIEREARASISLEGDIGRVEQPSPPTAVRQGGEEGKKKKKKKKKKGTKSSEGASLPMPGGRESLIRGGSTKPPPSQKRQTPSEQRRNEPLNKGLRLTTASSAQRSQQSTGTEAGWKAVEGRKKKETSDKGGGRGGKPAVSPPQAKVVSSPPPGKGKGGKKKAPRTAAVIITCDAGDYKDNLQHAVRNIDLAALEISGMSARKALTGAQVYEIKGPDNAKKADALAARLREVLAGREGVRITRPVMMAELRVRDLDESATPAQVADAIARATGCDPDNIKAGVIQRVGRGMGTLWMRCPVTAANKLAAAKKLRVGWVNARIETLEPRQLQCFKCLEKGHVQAQCSSGANRAACCYRCGGEGHIARNCKSPAKCPVCASLGRPDGHKAGTRACTAPRRRAKGGSSQPTPRAGTAAATTQRGGDKREEGRASARKTVEEGPLEVEMKETGEVAPPLPQRERRKLSSGRCSPIQGEGSGPMEAEQEEPNTPQITWV